MTEREISQQMNRRYPLVRNPYLRSYLYGYDFVSNLIKFGQQKRKKPLKKILLRNPAAFGDVLYTLRLIRAIKAVNPDIFVGLLCGSWVLPLVNACTDIDVVHVEDHWALSRRKISKKQKIIQWLRTRRTALKEIKDQQYDAAVDLYYYYPSAALLFWQAGIPMRVGYDSHEGSPLYTHCVTWENKDIHNIEYQAELISEIGLDIADLTESQAAIDFSEDDILLLSSHHLQEKRYIAISVGTGAPDREWPIERWQELLKRMSTSVSNEIVARFVFVGAGQREQTHIDALLDYAGERGLSLCNRLSIPELMQVIRNSCLFIGLESFAGHIAAMYKIPQVSIMHGATNQIQWQPFANPDCTVIRKGLSCSPCYFPSKCEYNNDCINISVDSVWNTILEIESRVLGAKR